MRGHTFVPDGSRGGRRVRLESREIQNEDTGDGGREIRFAMPALEPGAVFEYQVDYMSPAFVLLPRWYFQDVVPVVHSEVRYNVPQFLGYNFLRRDQVGIQRSDSNSSGDLGVTHFSRFVASNVPAMREEAFVAAIHDHMTWLQPQLSTYMHPRWGTQESFLRSWNEMADDVHSRRTFWHQLGRSSTVTQQAQEIAGEIVEPRDKARAIYNFVRTSMVWNERYSPFTSRSIDEILSSRNGTSGELNLLLAALLHDAGISVEPVLLSTRTRGRPVVEYPLLTQFNHLLVSTTLDGEEMLLDATEPAMPMGMVPVASLAGIGWKASRTVQEWIEITHHPSPTSPPW
ncbi:hypothetical protein BH23BAC4_BH23BAC4_01580 [soil metagenome]